MPKTTDAPTNHGRRFQPKPPRATAGTTKAERAFLHFELYRVQSKGIAQVHVEPFPVQIYLQAGDRLVNTLNLFDGKLAHVDRCSHRLRPAASTPL